MKFHFADIDGIITAVYQRFCLKAGLLLIPLKITGTFLQKNTGNTPGLFCKTCPGAVLAAVAYFNKNTGSIFLWGKLVIKY